MFILEFDSNRCHRRFDVADDSALAIAFHGASENIVIISTSDDLKSFKLSVRGKTSDGSNKGGDLELLRTYKYEVKGNLSKQLHATVTTKGRIAVLVAENSDDDEPQGKVIVY